VAPKITVLGGCSALKRRRSPPKSFGSHVFPMVNPDIRDASKKIRSNPSAVDTGALAAYVGGAKVLPGAARVTLWGALAMATTAAVGAIFGSAP
jgi:hypothetical protein